MLSSVLEEILQENKQYNEFKTKFEELFNDDKSEVRAQFEKLGGTVQNSS